MCAQFVILPMYVGGELGQYIIVLKPKTKMFMIKFLANVQGILIKIANI